MEPNDEEYLQGLIQKVASGDENAFAELYDCFGRSLYALGLRALNDPGRAEEMVQDAMVKVWRSAGSYDGSKGRVSSWVFTIARRTAVDLFRKHSRTPVPIEKIGDGVDEVAAQRESWRHWEIGRLLSILPGEQRITVEMTIIEGYTQADVARSLGVPLGTVKTRLYAGLRQLRKRLEHLDMVEASS